MNGPAAFLLVLAEKLRDAGVPWMLTGSAASSYYGEPRATNDLDIVVDPTSAQIEVFAASLSGSFYVSREEVREALAKRSMFNVIDPQSGWKADVILVGDREFDRVEFERRRSARLAANRETLDLDYLRRQAHELRVDDLLGQLLG